MERLVLEARDARQEALSRALGSAREQQAGCLLFISTNIPGDDKHRPGLTALVGGALDALRQRIDLRLKVARRDIRGPCPRATAGVWALEAKRAAVALEALTPAARLLDLDVYTLDGRQIDRVSLGLPPRPCLVCAEPARECIRAGRHPMPILLSRIDELLAPFRPVIASLDPEHLAHRLHRGAHEELELMPKPGLVDPHDRGSHPDLSVEAMRVSADLLPLYFQDLLRCGRTAAPWRNAVQAGLDAEARMFEAIGSNAHRGFLFLAGLMLMAAQACEGRPDRIRAELAHFARGHFAKGASGPGVTPSARVGGIRAEAEQGLPAIFEHGWPRYREALAAGWASDHARFYLMAILMQRLEDTTALHRCGPEGLARLRQDGQTLQRLLERGHPPEPWLAELNLDYRRSGLTMGGVADCMAVTFALG